MKAVPKYFTGPAAAARRVEITARLMAGQPMKAIAAAVGVCAQHVARLAREEEVQRVWLTRPEVALIAQLRAPVLTCPECQQASLRGALQPMCYEKYGTFFDCPKCAIGSLTTAWQPAKT